MPQKFRLINFAIYLTKLDDKLRIIAKNNSKVVLKTSAIPNSKRI
jgi:hypothetical protein